MSLPSSMAEFVPCDRLLQKAHSSFSKHEYPAALYIPWSTEHSEYASFSERDLERELKSTTYSIYVLF